MRGLVTLALVGGAIVGGVLLVQHFRSTFPASWWPSLDYSCKPVWSWGKRWTYVCLPKGG